MSITDRTRKMLWGKSGNKCAMCRHSLVLDPTDTDTESVIGEECHIVSAAKSGPRHDHNFPQDKIDDISNLILLCRIHHKQIDDQVETYTADLLREIKGNHEKWVNDKLQDEDTIPPLRIKRNEKSIPKKLPVIHTGKELLNLAIGCHGAYNDYSDNLDDEETELISGFIQDVSDWADIGIGMEPGDRVRASKSLNESIQELNSRGFLVFAALETQSMIGGNNRSPTDFQILHLSIARNSDPSVHWDE